MYLWVCWWSIALHLHCKWLGWRDTESSYFLGDSMEHWLLVATGGYMDTCVCTKNILSLSLYIYYIPYYIYNYICIYGLPSQTCVIGEIRVGSWPVVLHVVSVCFYLRHRVLFIFRFDGRGSVAVGFPGVHLCTIYMVAFVHQGSQTARSITRRWQNQVCSFKTFSSWGTWQGV